MTNEPSTGEQIHTAIVAASELAKSLDTLQRRIHGPFDSHLIESAAADVTAIYVALGESLIRCGYSRIEDYKRKIES